MKSRLVLVLAVAAGLSVMAGVAIYFWMVSQPKTVSPEVVGQFYTSLAALDVDETQRAVTLLTQATELAPEEPALWANLAVAHMRVRDFQNAQSALDRAVQLAPQDPRIAVLKAELFSQTGQVEAAIEQFRQVHQRQPDNTQATYALVNLLGQIRSEQADREMLELLSDILGRLPNNLRAQCEQARLAATLEQADLVRTTIEKLTNDSWPEPAKQQLQRANEALQAGDFRQAATALTFFENVLKPRPEYQQSLVELGVSSATTVGTPLRDFVRLSFPAVEAASADTQLTFSLQPQNNGQFVWAFPQPQNQTWIVGLSESTLQLPGSATALFPGTAAEADRSSVLAVDLNNDFRQDLVLAGPQGCKFLVQQADGTLAPHPVELAELNQPCFGVWAADIEMDGDLDLLLSDRQSPLRWIRNNGDMTFAPLEAPVAIDNVVQLQLADLDTDGDVDLVTLDAAGQAKIWWNERGGQYVAGPDPEVSNVRAITTADADRDGQFDLLALTASGQILQLTIKETWSKTDLVQWQGISAAPDGSAFLEVADLDNNGAVDLIASAGGETRIWLRDDAEWKPLPQTLPLTPTGIADTNADGVLDLVGIQQSQPQIAVAQSKAGYAWHLLEPKANPAPGDHRINSFGIGGRIEIRAGALLQAAAIRSPVVHFGLGQHEQANVGRIIWPNGTVQAEFDLKANSSVVANQRLKGSCPWVFVYDGKDFQFTKDFIWRSPLGLRINAQDTAGVLQTEDWIKIPGDTLQAVDGRYQVRITAELWETHFFDQVALMAVDHPADVEVAVDERFIPNQAPKTRVIAMTPPQPVVDVTDMTGQSLAEELRAADAVYADRFPLGNYQGVAQENWVEFKLPSDVDTSQKVLIVGTGWIYPTDSSINVAIAQRAVRPMGLTLDRQAADGTWQPILENLGFPAGKNKDVVIELPAEALTGQRLRLRTNMEIYWDKLAWSYERPDVPLKTEILPTAVAELRYRGFSKLKEAVNRRRPDIPIYQVEGLTQRWQDLEGFYTRFGDVSPLLEKIDDRYVIMNAGDELVFEFTQTQPVAQGQKRDFVLIGDGWVKDGDFNTVMSRWVRPLPTHDDADYAGPLKELWQEPIYRQHEQDWHIFHTRYVTPREFHRALWTQHSRK